MTNSNARPEVGKFYNIGDGFRTKEYARECLYVNENGFLLGTNAAGIPSFFFEHRRFKELVEYKPPVILKAWIPVVQWNGSKPHFALDIASSVSRSYAESSARIEYRDHELIDIVEVTWEQK